MAEPALHRTSPCVVEIIELRLFSLNRRRTTVFAKSVFLPKSAGIIRSFDYSRGRRGSGAIFRRKMPYLLNAFLLGIADAGVLSKWGRVMAGQWVTAVDPDTSNLLAERFVSFGSQQGKAGRRFVVIR
jgi:hypothetical protein